MLFYFFFLLISNILSVIKLRYLELNYYMYFIFVFIWVWVFNNYYLIKILVFWFIFNFKGYIIDGNLNVCINIYIKFFLIGILFLDF